MRKIKIKAKNSNCESLQIKEFTRRMQLIKVLTLHSISIIYLVFCIIVSIILFNHPFYNLFGILFVVINGIIFPIIAMELYSRANKANIDFTCNLNKEFYPYIVKVHNNLIKYGNYINRDYYKIGRIYSEYAFEGNCKTTFAVQGEYNNIPFIIDECLFHTDRIEKSLILTKGIGIQLKLNKFFEGNTIITFKFKNPKIEIFYPVAILALALLSYVLFVAYLCFATNTSLPQECLLFAALFIGIVIFLITTNPILSFKKISSGNMMLDKKIDIHTTGKIDCFEYINEDFINSLNILKKAFKGYYIQCSFFNNNALIFIKSRKKHFDIGTIWKPLSKAITVEEFEHKLKTIYDFISIFKQENVNNWG